MSMMALSKRHWLWHCSVDIGRSVTLLLSLVDDDAVETALAMVLPSLALAMA
jgi:hypothetical protein